MDKVQFEKHLATFRKCLHAVDSDDFTAVMDLQDAFYNAYFQPDFNNTTDKDEQAKANARLIAAAPELLAALVLMEALFTNSAPHLSGGVIGKTRAAIAKATGK